MMHYFPAVWQAIEEGRMVMLVHVCVFSRLFVTPWTVACQAPLSIGFSRQEYWSGLSFPSPWDLPNPGIKTVSRHWQADSLLSSWEAQLR